MVAEGDEPKKRSKVMALRRDRKSKVTVPAPPNVTHITVNLRTEWVDGRPVVRFQLPPGGKIEHEGKES